MSLGPPRRQQLLKREEAPSFRIGLALHLPRLGECGGLADSARRPPGPLSLANHRCSAATADRRCDQTMAHHPAHQTAMPGEGLETGVQRCVTRARYPVPRFEEERWRTRKHRADSQTSSTVQGAGLTVGQIVTISDGLLHSSEATFTPAGGRPMVTIADSSGRWNPRADAPSHEQAFGDLLPDASRALAGTIAVPLYY
jgi:hypothetical protein